VAASIPSDRASAAAAVGLR